MKTYAEVNTNTTHVVNMVVFEDQPAFAAPEGHIFVEAPAGVGTGHSYVDDAFVRYAVRLDNINFFAESMVLAEDDVLPVGWIVSNPPEAEGDHLFTGSGWVPMARADAPVITPPPATETDPRRVSKARFGDLFTTAEHRAMNLIRWQISQMTLEDRLNVDNPLPDVEVLFQKFDLPAEFIELNNPLTIQGVSVLGMLGVFGSNAEVRITQVLNDELPGANI